MADAASTQTLTSTDLISIINDKTRDAKMIVKITDGFLFDHFDTVNKIELYHASQFKTGRTDSQGDTKYFINKVNPPAGDVTKNIDLDRADITILPEDGADAIKAMLYKERLKQWMDEQRIGQLLNKVAENLPLYGQVVIRRRGPKVLEFVPLKYLYRDPGILGLKNSIYAIIHHRLLPEQLTQIEGLDQAAVQLTLRAFFRSGDRHINVYEFYGWVPEASIKTVTNTTGYLNFIKAKAIVAMNVTVAQSSSDWKETNSFNQVLMKTEWPADKPFPLKELNMFEIEGRGLGLGIIELLFDVQQRTNEMHNQKAKSMKISSKQIYQTRDSLVEKNLFTDVETGTIMKVQSEIKPVQTEERNLAAYNQEETTLGNVARSLANQSEVVSGDSLPSGTPYRLGQLLNENASKLHEYIREKFGLFFEDILNDWIIPEFEKEMNTEQLFMVEDPEVLEHLVEYETNRRLNDAYKKYVLKTGYFPTSEDMQLIRDQIKSEYKSREFVKTAAGYFNFGKKLRVVITNESINLKAQIESISNAIQLISQNPQALQMPETRRLLQALFGLVGISPLTIAASSGVPAVGPGGPAPATPGAGGVPAANQLNGGGQPQMDNAIAAGTQGVNVGR